MSAPAALFSSAVAHHRAGRLAEAVPLYEQVLAATPDHADTLRLLGTIRLGRGEAARAEELFRRALARQPDAPALLHQHGLALRALRRDEEALAAFRRALELDPQLAETHHQFGNLLKALGRYAEAQAALERAAALAPDRAAIRLNLGVAALEAGARDTALAAFHRAVALEPDRPESRNILGHTLAAAGRAAEARAEFEAALRLRPGYAAALNNLGRLARAEGLVPEAVDHFRAALAAAPSADTHSNLLLALNYLPDMPPADVAAEHRRWAELHAPPAATPQPARPASAAPPNRLRIGYLSPDFNHHAVAYFIEPVLAAHDRGRCEIFCYANVKHHDRFTARLQSHAEHWRDLARLDDAAAADLIRADDLDLLIDLAGHTAGHRLPVLARRPARAQATWLGYPNTTGLAAVDFRFTDAVSDPPGTTEHLHTEKLVRLPGPFSCYRPDDDAPAVGILPADARGTVTFGCFNHLAKLTPAVLALWTELLRALPDSRLFLKSRGLGDPDVAGRLRGTFAAAGIAPERICCNGDELSVADHLALYHEVDVALDPFPYNGTTTTCEALWMGVPVVTLAGRVHAARVGASLLTHVGLADWIAATPSDYVRIAVAAASDRRRLADLRAGLREQMRRSPLCDAVGFTRTFEQICLQLVRPAAPSPV